MFLSDGDGYGDDGADDDEDGDHRVDKLKVLMPMRAMTGIADGAAVWVW